ncbi:MAG: tyrosine-type recombinase/integrase [Sphaerochaetaceae bacterium]|nr:tyrosine-type recombinase/integrase [Sphaerochaetaceae bacterium]
MRTDEAISQYTKYRKNLGEKFRVNGFILKNFANYVGQDKELADIQLVQCTNFLYGKSRKGSEITSYWFCIYTALNGLFQWALHRGYVKRNPLPVDKPNKPLAFIPYIYSKDELKMLFHNALTYRRRFNILYPESVRIILMITYLLGLRPGETVKLCLSDIHLEHDNYALIRETKFYKSRIVPFNTQVALLLKGYIQWRKKNHLPEDPNSSLFVTRKGEPVKLTAIQQAFRLICDKSNIHRKDGMKSDTRIEDLRHTFATDRVTSWYDEGKNVQDLLPVLSTYLGHCNLDSTAVYISFTDALLRKASDKFESYSLK